MTGFDSQCSTGGNRANTTHNKDGVMILHDIEGHATEKQACESMRPTLPIGKLKT